MGRKSAARRRPIAVAERPDLRAAKLCQEAKMAIAKGDLAAAERAYVAAIALGTQDAFAFNNLATIYDKTGTKASEGFELLSKAFELAPESPVVRANFLTSLLRRATACEEAGNSREAVSLLLRRAALDPESAAAHRAVGSCYAKFGACDVALGHFARAIALDPQNASYYNDLGLAYFELRHLAEAQSAFQRVLELDPRSVVAFTHLGVLANLAGVMNVAVNMTRRALDIDPNCVEAHNNLALYLRTQGEAAESRLHYQQAMRLKPEWSHMFSGYLFSLNDDAAADPAWVAAEHRRFDQIVKRSGRVLAPRSPDPERKLRIGYISPDFRTHSVAYFIAPVLEAHDRDAVEITCYATGAREDELTERIRKAAERWRKVFRTSDSELATLIENDEIDVLIELSGHTADNRLAMLADRVAPVQVTYLGYPNTTGLASMDLRITDAVVDPPGVTDGWHTERLVRIDGGFLAYSPPSFASQLPVGPLPAGQDGQFTLGSFNNLAKINDLVLETWASILAQFPNSRILFKDRGLGDDRVKQRLLKAFAAYGGVGEDRVTLKWREASPLGHLQTYNEVDMALDPFPYNGTTTTCEALWMGVPVLTLAGDRHAGRVGTSLLSRVGLPEFVAKDRSEYIAKALALGGDRAGLAKLRSGLRERLMASPVMDGRRLARGLEAAYREAWREYCFGRGVAPPG